MTVSTIARGIVATGIVYAVLAGIAGKTLFFILGRQCTHVGLGSIISEMIR